MNRLRILVFSVGLVVIGLVLFLWPKKSKAPFVQLKKVRTTFQQGKPIVFFQLVAADSRGIQIDCVERILLGGGIDGPFGPSLKPVENFWAPSQSSPLSDFSRGREPFGVIAPSTAEVWKLRVTTAIDTPFQLKPFKSIWRVWRYNHLKGQPLLQSAMSAWKTVFLGKGGIIEPQVVESDFITNSVAFQGQGLK